MLPGRPWLPISKENSAITIFLLADKAERLYSKRSMRIAKVVILVIGALVFIYSLVTGGFSVGNDLAAASLFVFSVTASSYFFALPVSRNNEGQWRPNFDFAWFSIYLLVAGICAFWFYRLNR